MLPPLDLSIYLQEASIKYAVANLSHHTWSTDFAWSAWTTPLWPHPQSSHFTPQHWQHIHYKLEEEAQEEGRISQSVVEFNARMQTRDANLMQTKRQDRIKWQHSLWWRWGGSCKFTCTVSCLQHQLATCTLHTDWEIMGLTVWPRTSHRMVWLTTSADDNWHWHWQTINNSRSKPNSEVWNFYSLKAQVISLRTLQVHPELCLPLSDSAQQRKARQTGHSCWLEWVIVVESNGAFKNKHELSNTFC